MFRYARMPKAKAIALKPPTIIRLQGKFSFCTGPPPVFGKPVITGKEGVEVGTGVGVRVGVGVVVGVA